MSDPRTTGHAVLTYVPSIYSQGDYFEAALDFENHADMVRYLEPLGLGILATPGARVERVAIVGVSVGVDVYGTLVMLFLGPEDRFEHLSDEDFADARKVDACLHAAGLAARRGEKIHFDRACLPPPPRPRRPQSGETVYHLVRVARQTETGFACEVERKTLTSQANLSRLTILLTPETRHVDHLSKRPCDADVALDDRLLVRPTTGRGPDGDFATIAEIAEHVEPEAAGIEAAAALAGRYERAGIQLGLGSAEAIARMALFEKAMDPDWDLETALARQLLSQAHAYTGRWVGDIAFEPLVSEMLSLLSSLELPCDFRAHAVVRAAEARKAAGEDADAVVREVMLRMVEEANRALAKRWDGRRYRPARVAGEETWLLLETAQHDGLLGEGLIATAQEGK